MPASADSGLDVVLKEHLQDSSVSTSTVFVAENGLNAGKSGFVPQPVVPHGVKTRNFCVDKSLLLQDYKPIGAVDLLAEELVGVCGGIEYVQAGKVMRVYFPNPAAKLPIRTRSGEVAWLTWGKRAQDVGELPPGGWARLESIYDDKWQAFAPRPVIIMATRYLEKDKQGQSHWFDVPADNLMQGLCATHGEEQRVYVVTIAAPPERATIHTRCPRLVKQREAGLALITS